MESVVEQLAHSPRLSLYYQRIHELLEQEKAKREEFYRTIKEGDKAEFINGQMIFHSPVKARHLDASQRLSNLLYNFVERRKLGIVYYEKAMVSLTRNDYEPDICFWRSDQAAQFVPA